MYYCRYKIALASLAVMLLVIQTVPALSEDPTFPRLTDWVMDSAHLLNDDDKQLIRTTLRALEEGRIGGGDKIQFIVATVTSLQGYRADDFVGMLYDTWKIGSNTKHKGILLFVAIENDRWLVRVKAGMGISDATYSFLYNIAADRIAPYMTMGKYSFAIKDGVADMVTLMTADSWDNSCRAYVSCAGKLPPRRMPQARE